VVGDALDDEHGAGLVGLDDCAGEDLSETGGVEVVSPSSMRPRITATAASIALSSQR
jgi:hypothetical protein